MHIGVKPCSVIKCLNEFNSRYMAEILPILRLTLSNQSINQSFNYIHALSACVQKTKTFMLKHACERNQVLINMLLLCSYWLDKSKIHLPYY